MLNLKLKVQLFIPILLATLACGFVDTTVPTADVDDALVFNTPVGASDPGPLINGNAYAVTFSAEPGDYVSLATMFVESNDWIIGTPDWGIELYNDTTPRTGDVTGQLYVLDVGTEADEPVGEGENQAPRQAEPNTGDADPISQVRFISSVEAYISANLSYNNDGTFTLTINNISDLTPLAPGVASVHRTPSPLYAIGQADRGLGLGALAEDGNPAILVENLQSE